MRYRAIAASARTPELIRVWGDLVRVDNALESPFLQPEFTQFVSDPFDYLLAQQTPLATGATMVAVGAVELRRVNRALRPGWTGVRRIVCTTSLRGKPLMAFRRMRNWLTPPSNAEGL